jgi:nucleotide-binding universal stress UspA family protein
MPKIAVLAPLDQSSRDRIALPKLKQIAEDCRATSYLLHVISGIKAMEPQAARAAESYVDAFESQLRAQGADVHGIVRKGDPAEEITRVADEYKVDRIVMVTRGRRGLKRLVLGSVTDDVISKCPYPVLLLNEETSSGALDETVWTQSSYMAGMIWNQVARGLLSEEEATAQMEHMVAMGLDHDVLHHTYTTLRQSGAPASWLDIDFQQETLEQFAPELLPKDEEPAA